MKVPFFRPSIDAADEARVLGCIRSGWLTTGSLCREFEEAVQRATGAKHAIAMSSCTAALHCALAYRCLGPGDEVVVPSYTFVATASAVHHAGGLPVLCDVSDETFCIDLADVERRITPRTRGIVAVDFAGHPCDLAGLQALCAAHKWQSRPLFLLRDAAHSLGAFDAQVDRLDKVGAQGDVCFSFYANKNVTTGEGGMLVTASEALADFARRFRQHGMDVTAWNRYGGAWRPYDVGEFGYKYNLPDVLAALGIGQIARLAEITEARLTLARRYNEALTGLPLCLPQDVPGHAWHLHILRTEKRDVRDRLMAHLSEWGIGTAIHYPPLHQMSVFGLPDAQFPVSAKAYETALSLPLYPGLTEDELGHVVDSIRGFFA